MKTAKKLVAIFLAVLMSLSCFSIISFAEEATEHLTEVPEGYIGVYTIEDLYCVRNDLTANYILMNDIDLSEATAEGGDWDYAGKGWNPIGSDNTYSNCSFSGVFDGNNYGVFGLRIDLTTASLPSGVSSISAGLFTSLEGEIKNLTVKGNITTTKIKPLVVGGIVACSFGGKITNCISAVNIDCSSSKRVYAGGILGYATDDGNGNVTQITNCVNVGDINLNSSYRSTGSYTNKVSRGESYISGILAYANENNVTINKCINTGNLYALSNGGSSWWTSEGQVYTHIVYYYNYCDVYASGISNHGFVTNCYNVGNVTAALIDGGEYATLCAAGISYSGEVKSAYNVGTSSHYAVNKKVEAVNCYFLNGSGLEAAGSVVLSNAQMKIKSMFSQWDFTNVWTMSGNEEYAYPELIDTPLVFSAEISNHTHKYAAKLIRPTCIEQGYTTYTCSICGDSYVADHVDETGHSHTSEVTTPATHTTTGIMTYTCHCGDTYTETIAKIAEHKYESVVTAPTCEDKGYTTYTCECGDSYIADYVDETGHSYTSEVTTPATHTATGVMTYTCSCGDTYTETIEKIAKHEYESVVTAPTCEDDGFTTYTCSCGDSYIDNYVDALGHDFSEWTVTTPATCTENGKEARECSRCDKAETRVIESAGHSHKATVTAPTCTEQGYTTFTCSCGDSYVADYVDAKSHTAGEWVVTKPVTSTQSGTKTQSCTVCGTVLNTQTIPAYGKVRGVSVSNVSLDYKSSTTLNPQISVDADVKYTVSYSSSNPSVASVDANGKVSTGKTGSATITVTVTDEYGNTVKDTCEVKVSYNWWQWIIVIVLFGWIWY